MRNLLIILAALFLCACADKYAVTYVLDPPGNLDLKNKVTVTVRDLIDRRPSQERVGPAEPLDGAFYSEDGVLEEPLSDSLTRLLQLELSNAGLDVVDSANYTPGQERTVRVAGEIYHAFVMAVPESPVSDDKLWKRMRYTVRVAVRVDMIDTLPRSASWPANTNTRTPSSSATPCRISRPCRKARTKITWKPATPTACSF